MKTIRTFQIDLSDMSASKQVRSFIIEGDDNAIFSLEITNEDSPKKYYNFTTKTFQAAQSRLEETILTTNYKGSIVFPTVTDDDKYDFHFTNERDAVSEYNQAIRDNS